MKIKSRKFSFVVVLLILMAIFPLFRITSPFTRITITKQYKLVRSGDIGDPLALALSDNKPLSVIESILISHGHGYESLNKPIPLSHSSKMSESYLDEAVKRGRLDAAELLVKYGANPNGLGIDGSSFLISSPIINAIHRNDKDMVVLLLELGASPTVLVDGTPVIRRTVYSDTSNDIKDALWQHSPYARYLMDYFHVEKFGVPFHPILSDIEPSDTDTNLREASDAELKGTE